jgi:hypothetical protein
MLFNGLMKVYLRYVLLFSLFMATPLIKATHVRAGEITYKWLSGKTYSITLTTYTDDGPSVADRCKMTIHLGDGDSCVAYRQNGSLAPSSSECSVSYSGAIIKTSPTVKKNVYSCIHTYSGTGSFTIYVLDRNRNSGVINIANSVNQPFYIQSILVIGTLPNNSSLPSYDPIDEGGLGKCFYHNRGAYDLDGDSLSYEISACLGGQDPISGQFNLPLSGYTHPDPGPSGTFTINSVTGTITWCSSQSNGEYNIAFITKEWRKQNCGAYTLVGTVLRDMQIIINNSGSNNLPLISILSNTCVVAGSNYTIPVSATDPENNSVTLSAGGMPFFISQAASFGTVSAVNPAGTFSWNVSCAHIRKEPYMVTYKAIDNAPTPLASFTTQNITVMAPGPQNLSAAVGTNIVQLQWNKPVCHPASGNKISHYDVYRSTGTSTWTPSNCETGVPASSGLTYAFFTYTENDTTAVDYTVISLPNNTFCSYAVAAVYEDCSQSIASNVVTSQLIIGLDEIALSLANISVYPNPSTGNSVNIDITSAKDGLFILELFDLNGRRLKSLNPTFVSASKTQIIMDLSELAKGYYFLKVEDEKKNCVYKPLIKL